PADLHDELSGLRELENLVILVAVAADPDETFRIDVDAMLGVGPLVSLARSAPRLDEGAPGVKFQQRRRRSPLLFGAQRARALEDPDVILSVDSHARDLPELPVIRNPRPRRVDLEPWRFCAGLDLRDNDSDNDRDADDRRKH